MSLAYGVGVVAPFIRWLLNRGAVGFGLVADDTDAGFDARFRIQKYVFLAQRLGLGTKYKHSRYRYGPYSTKLAKEYYLFAEDPDAYRTESEGRIPGRFRPSDFLDTVAGYDDEWLEAVTTLIDPLRNTTRQKDCSDMWRGSNAYPKSTLTVCLMIFAGHPLAGAVCY